MLNEKRIRLMTQLARYENGDGKEDLRVSKYYRGDFIGLALLKNFVLTSIGYVIALALVAAYFMDYLMENVHKMNIILLIVLIVSGYVITMTVFSVITYATYSMKYSSAKRRVEWYGKRLSRLSDLYGKEEIIKNQKLENRRKQS